MNFEHSNNVHEVYISLIVMLNELDRRINEEYKTSDNGREALKNIVRYTREQADRIILGQETNCVEEVDIEATLKERGERYGRFAMNAEIAQMLKDVLPQGKNWKNTRTLHREALHMIAHKMARIVNGDPDYLDNWTDIAGYAQLVVRELDANPETPQHHLPNQHELR